MAPSIGEYAICTYVPQLRVRYPLFDGRLMPYLVTGTGFSFGGEDFAPVTVAGIGIEYFVASNMALGAETKYLYSCDHTLKTSG